jgi:hypothetical protein
MHDCSFEIQLVKRRDPLTMGYFDNLNNEPLNKYKKILKMNFFYRYVLLLMD